MNVGQTCIAPDYVLCSKEVESKMIPIMKRLMKEWYGDQPQKSKDLTRIISERHFDRLVNLLKTSKGKVVIG